MSRRPRQYVIATLGRLDRLRVSGQVDAMSRIDAKADWDEIRGDLDALHEVKVAREGKSYLLRSPLQGYVERY